MLLNTHSSQEQAGIGMGCLIVLLISYPWTPSKPKPWSMSVKIKRPSTSPWLIDLNPWLQMDYQKVPVCRHVPKKKKAHGSNCGHRLLRLTLSSEALAAKSSRCSQWEPGNVVYRIDASKFYVWYVTFLWKKSSRVRAFVDCRCVDAMHTYTVSGPYSIWTTYDPPCVKCVKY